MKYTSLMLILFVFQSIASTYAQTTRIDLNLSQSTLKQVFKEIESKTEYTFFYNDEVIDLDRVVDVKVRKATIDNILEDLLTNCTYRIENKNILLIPKGSDVAAGVAQQEKRQVSGTVVDNLGDAVIGANVMEKGTSNGVITDLDGHFSLFVSENALLQVSYIGYVTQEVATKGQSRLTITMREDALGLDEVVVVGYGVQKKANLSGAVETVSSKALENRSTSNVALALQGLVPNLTISANGGQANAEPSFNIRGETSINGGTPLILIDGIPSSGADFSRMNSMDIENISILKDASSAAIYGARASFGVILITTKKGKGEKLTVQFNNNLNVRTLTNMPKSVLDPYIVSSYKDIMGQPWYDIFTDEELAYAKKRSEDPSLAETILNPLNPNKYSYLASHDWFEEIFDNVGITHQHNLSVSGSTDKASYYLGTEYYGEAGMLHYNKDQYNRFNVRSKVEYRPFEWLSIGNNTAFTYYKYDRPTNFGSWLYGQMVETNPLVPVYNPDGSYTKEGAQTVGTLKSGGESVTKSSMIYTQFTAEADLLKDIWKIKADFTAKLNDRGDDSWDSDRNIPYREGPNTPELYLGWENYAQKAAAKTIYTLLNLYTDIHKDFGAHSLSAIGGFSQEYEHYNQFRTKRNDLITDTYPTIQLATGDFTVTEDDYAWAIRSAFYRLNYIYDNKYILETNGRYDGTSRFPHQDRFGFFPSVSAAWVFSQEKFLQSVNSWLNHGKLRASYGSLGNQNVNYYSYIASMSASKLGVLVNGEKPMGVYKPGMVSDVLTWEKVYTLNGGIDLNFLSNRLIFSADVYRRDTKDMLTKGKTLPNVFGTSEPKVNAADLKTRGWEVSLFWRDRFELAAKPFNYSARFILSDSRSWITRFDNPTRHLGDYYVGQELGEIWGMVTEGFFKDQADIDNHADQWKVTSYPGDRPIEPGDLKYRDLNDDGEISRGSGTVDDPGDFKVIGNSRNRYLYGLDLNADWNGFDMRILVQGVAKKQWYPTDYKFYGVFLAPWGNVFEHNMDHWTPDNTDAYFPRLKSYVADYNSGDMVIPQTRYLQNAAYMRLKNVTFGYSLPKQLLQKIKIDHVRIYFSGENLFEATPLCKSYDPEQLDQFTHPMQRTYSIGLNITL